MPRKQKELIVPKPIRLSNGDWCIYLRLRGERYKASDTNYNRCIAKARAIKADIIKEWSEEREINESMSLYNAIDKYIESRRLTLSPSTVRGYKIIQNNRFKNLMDEDVYKINRIQLQTAVNEESEKVSAKTLKNSFNLIRAAICYITDKNFNNITLPQIVPNEHAFLKPEQILKFLNAIRGTDIELACLLGLWSLRQSEISAVLKKDFDFQNNIIHVCRSMVPDENNKMIVKPETKNISSNRYIPLFPRIKELIPKDLPDDTPVVTLRPAILRNKINRICGKNGLPRIGVHGLRHSFASLGYFLGIPEKEIMAIGGWSNDATMKKIYTHISEQQKQNAANQMMEFYIKNDFDSKVK